MEERAILLKGNFLDLEEILIHARNVGKKLLKIDRVNVKPEVIHCRMGYLVVIAPEKNGNEGKSRKDEPTETTIH
jgi:hypothetical protein